AIEARAGHLHQAQAWGRRGHLAREGHAHQHVDVAKPRGDLALAARHAVARALHPRAHAVRELAREDAGEGHPERACNGGLRHIRTIWGWVVSESTRAASSVTRVCA